MTISYFQQNSGYEPDLPNPYLNLQMKYFIELLHPKSIKNQREYH